MITLLFLAICMYFIYKLLKGEVKVGKYTKRKMLFDFVMTIITGGAWLIWVVIRYLRTH